MKSFVFALTLTLTPQVFARQSLQAAMTKSPALATLVEAVKTAAGVECTLVDSFQSEAPYGPDGKTAITQQTACYDPMAFNPSQLGQLIVTYYGDGKTADSEVGAVIAIQFEVFK